MIKKRLHYLAVFLLLGSLSPFKLAAQVDYTIGTSTTGNSGTGYPAPLQDYYEGSRAQYLYTAAELAAAGMSAGDITAISWNVTALNGTGIIENYTVSIAQTSTTSLTTSSWETTSVVVGAQDYQPVLGQNTFVFDAPFTWNGTDNIVVEVCNGANITSGISTYTNNATTPYTTGLSFNGSHTYVLDNMNNLCGTASTTQTGNATTRPDITFTITSSAVCSGAVTAGSISSSASSVCNNQTFTLSSTGFTTGNGITYQWQSSPAGAGNFTDISGATSPTFSTTQTDATDYQLVVSCTNPGGGTDVSPIASVGQNSFLNCYCTPVYSNACTSDDVIDDFTLTGENGTSFNDIGTGCSAGNYDDRTAQPAVDLAAGISYNGTISSLYSSQDARIWIDLNDDGFFTDSDTVGSINNFGTTATAFTIMLPATATPGAHRMRVRDVYNQTTASAIDPCTNYSYGETHDYTVNVTAPPSCLPPSGLMASNLGDTSATLTWNMVSNAVIGYEYLVDNTSATPAMMGTFTTDTFAVIGGLTAVTDYYLHVRSICAAGDTSSWATTMFTTTLVNDYPNGAIQLIVNNGCFGAAFTSVGAGYSAAEPFTSCKGTTGYRTVWYKFTAPSSGNVKVSNDYSGGTLGDTRMAVFAATDSSDYSTFTIIGCDDDNGVVSGTKSIVYLNGLTAGNTYYVLVDNYSAGAGGTFCLTVDDIDTSMLAQSGSCVAGQGVSSIAASYAGWISLVDGNGDLIANVRQTTSTTDVSYSSAVTINPDAAPLRTDSAVVPQNYLDRNYFINAGSAAISNAEIVFFFTQNELDSLGASLGSLNVTRQPGTVCHPDFSATYGATTLLPQTSSNSANGVASVTVSTPGFSNFYLNAGPSPLEITLDNLSATNVGSRNRVDWNTVAEHTGDMFEIERSADGRSFATIASRNATGAAGSYSYFDEAPFHGINYYRLKLADKSGTFIYSKVVSATVKGDIGTFTVLAYPNPIIDNRVRVEVRGTMSTDAHIAVTDVTGKVVRTYPASDAVSEIDLSNLGAGIYLIRYTDKEHSQTLKVTKQ